MKIGIVGHGEEKFDVSTELIARAHIRSLFTRHSPDSVCSGESPMGGIDIWAREETVKAGIHFQAFPAEIPYWEDKYGTKIGYKARNLQIAEYSDIVYCIVVKDYPKDYHGMVFKTCYHCKNRNPQHIKSGGCWTAWKCPKHEWIII
jgi:hypothetical protein